MVHRGGDGPASKCKVVQTYHYVPLAISGSPKCRAIKVATIRLPSKEHGPQLLGIVLVGGISA